MMDSFILTLAMRWLPSSDAFSALLVCKEWRDALLAEESGGELWQHICRNAFPLATEAFIQANADVNATDFRSLIASFVRRDAFSGPSRQAIAPASLRPEDVFAIVQLFRKPWDGRRTELASWVCPFVGDPEHALSIPEDEINLVITGANPYWEEAAGRYSGKLKHWNKFYKQPLYYAVHEALGGDYDHRYPEIPGVSIPPNAPPIEARVTLFRRDNMTSVCIMDRERNGRPVFDDVRGNATCWETTTADFYVDDGEVLYPTTDDSGRNARLLMDFYGYRGMTLQGNITLQADLPVSGSDEEPEWLKNYRRLQPPDVPFFRPSYVDEKDLSSIPSFDFKVTGCTFDLKATAWSGDNDMVASWSEEELYEARFVSQEDLMIAIEGLCWN